MSLNIAQILTNNVVHIHNHTFYSFLDGMGSPEERVLRAKELGMTALAISDHNHLGGVLEFQAACYKHGIKPILGVELYWTFDMDMISKPKDERDKIAMEKAIEAGVEIPKKAKKKDIAELIAPYAYDTKNYHIILIAKNQEGWKNLVRIQSEAADRGLFNGRYHCDNELLRRYSEGIIITTACIGSIIGDSIRNDKYEVAEEILKDWVDIVGKENVFVEIQGLAWEEQYRVNLQLIELAKENDIKVIATNDVHYTYEEDHDDHDTLLCIGTGKYKDEENRMTYDHEYWLRSYDEMIEAFSRRGGNDEEYMATVREALANTFLIANMVEDIKLGSDVDLFTEVDVPVPYTVSGYLNKKCWDALYPYLVKSGKQDQREVYEQRLKYELDVINAKGYSPYMLTVEEYINWANENGCPTGPGRGSAAGSLVLFLLGITRVIDPVEYGLLFSRFLTPDRTSPPDVDTDFCYYGRQSVIRHLEEKYGHDKVSHIGTYTEMGVKSGLKDVGRVLRVDFATMNNISKAITEITDDAPSIKFKDLDALGESEEEKDIANYERFKEIEATYPELFRLARRFEGTKRNAGVHASGVLVTPMPISDLFPTRTVDGVKVTLYTGPQLEECKAIKYDILGLKTVSVIDRTIKSIDETLTWEDLYQAVEIDDEGIFNMICDKKTDAMFQIESDLFKGIISDMQPRHINDITVLTSLGRPGPLSAGMHTKYNNRKNGLEDVVMPLANIEDIVGETYGTIVYQEHVMLIAQKVAGFDDNQADSYLRKALAKKKKSIMDLCKQWLIYGKVNEDYPQGYDEKNPNQVMYDPTGKYGAPIQGALSKGYNIQELEAFWNDMEGYASYLFNKSHAACYSYITLLTAYLKTYYPVEFFAALFSIQDDEKKRAGYIKIAEEMGITIDTPDINLSKRDFTPIASENRILYGLGSIKGVGDSSIDPIIENTPYNTLDDLFEKLDKKAINKRVGTALIKSGALKHINDNRIDLLNQFYTTRKDKDELVDMELWNEEICMQFETDTLGTAITYKPWYEEVPKDTTVELHNLKLKSVNERVDRNGNLMAFATVESRGCTIDTVIFARTYTKNANYFDMNFYESVSLKGKKDAKGKFVVSSVIGATEKRNEIEDALDGIL